MTTIEQSIDVAVPAHRLRPVDPVRGVPRFMEGVEAVTQSDDTHLPLGGLVRRSQA